MHWTNRRQRKKAMFTTLVVLLLIIGTLGYTVISIQEISQRQEQQYQELKQDMRDLSTEIDNKTEQNRLEYQKKLDRMGDYLIDTREDYKEKTKELLSQVKKAEKENNVRLNNLRAEINNLSKKDMSKVVDNVIKAAVSINNNVSKGSGAVLTKNGYIATNNHVVSGLDKTSVIGYSGANYTAEVVQSDQERDLAILKVNETFNQHLELANSNNIIPGESVIAIGNPKGLEFTVTQGIVSAGARVFDEDEGAFIQTDVPINSGSSGGPLINSEGDLVGINTFKIKGSESLGFAIPSNDVKIMLEKARGNVSNNAS